MKTCSKCGETKALDAFSKKSGRCKACKAALTQAWRADNTERVREVSRAYYYANRDKLLAYASDYQRTEHGRAVSYAAKRRYYQTDKGKEMRRRMYARRSVDQKIEHRERVKRWWKTPNGRAYVARRNARRRSRLALVSDITAAQWKELVTEYGSTCAYCKKAAPLTRDHVIPLSQGGHDTKANIVPACQSCNSSKGARTPEQWKASTCPTL